MSKKSIIVKLTILSIILFFIGCGGKGGAFGGKKINNSNVKYQIQAIDGYIKNATIKDSNGSIAKYDSTLKNGTYYFTTKPTGTITLSGGTIESSGIEFDIELNCDYESSKIISPITTFIQGNYLLANQYKSILGIDNLNINYISSDNLALAKLSQLFYLLIKEKSLGESHKTYIKNNTLGSIDEVFSAVQSDINSSTLSNKTTLSLFVNKIAVFDDNVSKFETYIKDYKVSIGSTTNITPIFKTNISKEVDGDDGHYHKGVAHSFSRDDTNEIIKDETLNLEWEDTSNTTTFRYTQHQAELHCKSLDINGTNWRVPTISELQTLRDFNTSQPAINLIFVNKSDNNYLSSSRKDNDSSNINFWNINFSSGLEVLSSYYTSAYLRCVRGDKYINSTPLLRDNGIISDSTHNLMWQDSNENISLVKSYYDAISYCENLDYANHDDWRLPNINELNSIYDKSNQSSSFAHISNDSYWSSSSYKANSTMAWAVLNNKALNIENKNSLNSTRCVRDN